MEIPNADKFMIIVVLSEFFGIMTYSLAVNLNDGTHLVPLIMFTMIIITQGISGGHLNPALTFAVYIERNKFVSYACWAFTIILA
jgi:glycerol uptake facilitator-like aquaporin